MIEISTCKFLSPADHHLATCHDRTLCPVQCHVSWQLSKYKMVMFLTKISSKVVKIFLILSVVACIIIKLFNKPIVSLSESNNPTAPLIILWNGYQEHDELWARVFHKMTSGILDGSFS